MTTGAQLAGPSLKAAIAQRLLEMRERTWQLVAPVSDEDLAKVHEPTMGPVNWDLAHVPYFEEFWLVHGIHGEEEQLRHYDDTYDAEKQPRPTRDRLAIPPREAIRGHMEKVRGRVLEELEALDLDAPRRLTRGGFLHENILQHEAQHQENVLITLQLVPGRYAPSLRLPKPPPRVPVEGMALVRGGTFEIGTALAPGIYDNEAPRHAMDLGSFRISRAPVTNGEYLRFIDAGGYSDPRWWSEDGWDLRAVHKWRHPKHWAQRDDGTWWRREFDLVRPVAPGEPVVHVSWYEAEAFARWAGKRLPSEAEWEVAATWDPGTGTKRRYPWGDAPWTPDLANLDHRLFGPAPVGAYPAGASAHGCHQMLGDAWEWTADDFHAYPGFEPFPYDEYSVPFFNRGFKVLRGGSWATRPHVARGTFRNWHQQDHQQLFAGFRLAEDA